MNDAESPVPVVFSAAEIERRNRQLAEQIAADMGRQFLVVAILKGSFVFAADLIRALHRAGVQPEIDFMSLASYGTGRESSGRVTVQRDIADEVTGRDILLIDDILESGRTLDFAKQTLLDRGANSVRVCILLDKPGKRAVNLKADYAGFVCPDLFVVGYGLDFANLHRELPYIGHVDRG